MSVDDAELKASQRAGGLAPDCLARHVVFGVVLGVAALVLYGHNVTWLAERWRWDEYYQSGWLIPPIAVLLVWLRRRELAEVATPGSSWGLLLVLPAGLIYLADSWVKGRFPTSSSLILFTAGLVWWIYGWPTLKLLAFPIAFLMFMVPMRWAVDSVTWPMQVLSTKCAALLPRMLQMPTVVDGVNIHVPGYSLVVDVPCSGMKSITQLATVGALLAYLASRLPMWKRLLLFGAAFPLAEVANVVRIDVTIILGRTLGEKAAEGFMHQLSGLLVFALAVVGLLGVWRLLEWRGTSSGEPSSSSSSSG
jgi:exosortase